MSRPHEGSFLTCPATGCRIGQVLMVILAVVLALVLWLAPR